MIGPEVGELAEGELGAGRMSEPEEIAARCLEFSAARRTLPRGKHVVVSAGGTREPLDSSALSATARRDGWASRSRPRRAARRGRDAARREPRRPAAGRASMSSQTPTAADLAREALARADADVVLMAAAVADYRPADR